MRAGIEMKKRLSLDYYLDLRSVVSNEENFTDGSIINFLVLNYSKVSLKQRLRLIYLKMARDSRSILAKTWYREVLQKW